VEVRPVIEWIDDNALAYVPVSGAEIRTLDTGASRTNTQAPRFTLPELIRKSDDNRAGIVAMRALSAKRVMVVYDEGTLAVLDGAAAPRLHGMQTGTLSAAHSVSIGARGGLIVSVNQDDGIVVATECPVEPSQAAPGCTNRTVAGVNGKVVAVSPDEKRFVVGDQSGSITIYDRDGSPIGGPLAIGGLPGAIAWGAKDQLAVATRVDITQPSKIVRLQIGPAGTETKETTTGEASMLAWSGDGNALAFGCGKAVCLWLSRSTADGAVEFGQVRRLLGHDAAVTGVGWSRDGSRLASLSPDGIRIWTVNQNRDVSFALYAEAPARLSKVAVSRDGKWVAAGAGDGTLRIWDSASTELKRKETLGDASVESLAWTKAGAVAACLDDGTITIVSPDGAQAVQKLDDAQCETRIAFVDGDRSIATPRRGSKEVALIPIGEPTARKEQTVGSFGAVPSGLAWDEGLIRLFVACDDGLPRAVDVAGKSVRTMTPTAIPDNRGAGSLSVSADGKWLATSGGDRYVRIYAIAANAGAETLVMEQDEPNVVAFNTDATRLAALGTRNRLYVWTRAAGTSERFAIVDVDLARPLVAEKGGDQITGWMAWLGGDSIAVATGVSTIRVINLDPANWLRRLSAIVPRKIQP